MPTMQDIAKKCGVSKSTVSKALNGASDVSQSLRRMIIETAIDLGYNRTIQLSGEKKLALFIGSSKKQLPGHFGYKMIQSIKKEALIHDFQLDIHLLEDIDMKNTRYDSFMLEHKYMGGFFLSMHGDEDWLEQFNHTKTPTILNDRYCWNEKVSCVSIDTMEGIHKIIRHLYHSGHTRIGYLSSHISAYIFQQRYHNYLLTMEHYNLPVDERQVGLEQDSEECIQKHLQNLIDFGCTAIVCSHDTLALRALEYCQKNNIPVPEKVSFVGIDDIEGSALSTPPLTTLRQNQIVLGKSCFFALMGQIQGSCVSRTLIHPELILRDSVKNLLE
ncbi:MAG: LacI family DNA-binding transcriptional regulator [Bacillota bacterium]|nr:LacI family DNA-binding transcriptional regulator [Bacillota bacterium]